MSAHVQSSSWREDLDGVGRKMFDRDLGVIAVVGAQRSLSERVTVSVLSQSRSLSEPLSDCLFAWSLCFIAS